MPGEEGQRSSNGAAGWGWVWWHRSGQWGLPCWGSVPSHSSCVTPRVGWDGISPVKNWELVGEEHSWRCQAFGRGCEGWAVCVSIIPCWGLALLSLPSSSLDFLIHAGWDVLQDPCGWEKGSKSSLHLCFLQLRKCELEGALPAAGTSLQHLSLSLLGGITTAGAGQG